MKLEAAVQKVYTSPRHGRESHNFPCCVLVADVIALLADASGVFSRGSDWWKAANIWDENLPYSSIAAAAQVVLHHTGREPTEQARFFGPQGASAAVASLSLDSVYVVQGWRTDGTGHTFFLRTHPTTPGGCLVVESSVNRGLRIGGEAWRDASWRPEHQFALSRLETYDSGIGLVRLWDV